MTDITALLGIKKPKTKILFLSSEEAPFAKVGGLGEVIFSLPRALKYLGFDARVMIPLYGSIDKEKLPLQYAFSDLQVPTSSKAETKLICNVKKYTPPQFARYPVTTYFLENQEYYELRSNVYGYSDDRIRFALLCRGCLEFLATSREWVPDIIVCADWMTGYLPNLLKTEYRDHKVLGNIATLFSIHNLAIQGTGRPLRFIPDSERDDGNGPLPDLLSEEMAKLNPMRRGIIHADLVNTVSPTYAKEITTEEYGEGLEELLREKRSMLYGILNGIDFETNDPGTDRGLASRFTAKNIEARDMNKAALQKRLGLPAKKDAFFIGIISRLSKQKGFDLLQPVIDPFLRATGSQLVVVGTGDSELMDFFQDLSKRLPEQAAAHLQYDDVLPHLVFAGCDAILIPSKYEPSGLTQMEAMRFGAVPVARRTGGLADTIDDLFPDDNKITGFLFNEMDPHELLIAMTRAFANWRHRNDWRSLQKRVMMKDFSWNRSAREYADLFQKAIAAHQSNALPTSDLNGI